MFLRIDRGRLLNLLLDGFEIQSSIFVLIRFEFISLHVVEGYSNSSPSVLTYTQYSHPHLSCFQLVYSNQWP